MRWRKQQRHNNDQWRPHVEVRLFFPYTSFSFNICMCCIIFFVFFIGLNKRKICMSTEMFIRMNTFVIINIFNFWQDFGCLELRIFSFRLFFENHHYWEIFVCTPNNIMNFQSFIRRIRDYYSNETRKGLFCCVARIGNSSRFEIERRLLIKLGMEIKGSDFVSHTHTQKTVFLE